MKELAQLIEVQFNHVARLQHRIVNLSATYSPDDLEKLTKALKHSTQTLELLLAMQQPSEGDGSEEADEFEKEFKEKKERFKRKRARFDAEDEEGQQF